MMITTRWGAQQYTRGHWKLDDKCAWWALQDEEHNITLEDIERSQLL